MKLSLNTSGLPLQDLVFGASRLFSLRWFKAVLLGFFIWLFLHRQLRDWMYAGDIWHPLLMDLSLFALAVCLALVLLIAW
ncbi:membrane protein [Klebsiella pneumoniae]|uniref:Membrane protein n=1 Tax=Klebsiella pneumoniae TaxID=573 RepID=A0A3S4GPB7_KLEPN|nr:membrane protein [Klebsiella pneumoniae]